MRILSPHLDCSLQIDGPGESLLPSSLSFAKLVVNGLWSWPSSCRMLEGSIVLVIADLELCMDLFDLPKGGDFLFCFRNLLTQEHTSEESRHLSSWLSTVHAVDPVLEGWRSCRMLEGSIVLVIWFTHVFFWWNHGPSADHGPYICHFMPRSWFLLLSQFSRRILFGDLGPVDLNILQGQCFDSQHWV